MKSTLLAFTLGWSLHLGIPPANLYTVRPPGIPHHIWGRTGHLRPTVWYSIHWRKV